MKVFMLTVSTPDGNAFSGECVKLDVRGIEGELAIMAGHVPFFTSVVKGDCDIHLENGTILEGELDGGVLSMDGNAATLLAGSFRFLKNGED